MTPPTAARSLTVEQARRTLAGTRFGDLHGFDTIDSTNRWLAERAREGAHEGLVAMAAEQTAGRGRLGRTWVAPAGSALLVSVLVRPRVAVEDRHLVTLALALAGADAAAALGAEGVALKWPNDLVVPSHGDRKLAGVLAEAVGDAVVVGMGLNLVRPAEVDPTVAERGVWLDELGAPGVTPAAAAVAVLERLAGHVAALEADPARLLEGYRPRCTTVGRAVRVELPGRTLHATAVGIDRHGQLLVQEPGDGTLTTVTAGDVVHVRPA